MINVYINYPNPHIAIHRDPTCGTIRQHNKSQQRIFNINPSSLGDILIKFINQEVPFAPQAGINDLWLDINLSNEEQERSVVVVIQALIGQRYGPLANVIINNHC